MSRYQALPGEAEKRVHEQEEFLQERLARIAELEAMIANQGTEHA